MMMIHCLTNDCQAMQHHGLGHLPQPDNFTTCGRLGIEINQYNNPVECYNDDTIEEMRDEKIILDHPELAERVKSTQVRSLDDNVCEF